MNRILLTTLTAALFLTACAAEEEASPDAQDESGLAAVKADGGFSRCELESAVALVNGDDVTLALLQSHGIHTRAAKNILAARAGADGVIGTGDDRKFATPEELDDVFFVGPTAWKQMVAVVTDSCIAPSDLTVDVIFSPQAKEDSHLARVADLIGSAKSSIDIAMYSFSDSAISEALAGAVARGLSVRMVFESAKTDRLDPDGSKSAKLEALGVDVRYINKIMHHKYAIIDGPRERVADAASGWLVTGSANWSNSAATRYDENTVFIRGHEESLLRFQAQFNLMWNNSRDFAHTELFEWFASMNVTDEVIATADDVDFDSVMTSDNFEVKDSSFGATFSAVSGRNTVSDKLVELIGNATKSIHVASGHLRSRPVSEAIMAAKEANPELDVRVYLDSQEYISSSYHNSQVSKLNTCLEAAGDSVSKRQKCMDKGFLFGFELHSRGVDVRYKYYAYRWHYSYAPQMHHKYLIIDGETLASGSYNLSDNAEHNTLENVAIYSGAPFKALVQSYQQNFETLWTTGESDDLFTAFKHEVTVKGEASEDFPIVFDAMSLNWDQVTELKGLIRDMCPMINSNDYRKSPESHTFCDFE